MRTMFSILIPTYNRPNFLTEAIDSILENEFDDYEILVSDDCSPRTEEIATIVKPYLEKHPNIFFFSQRRNLGWAENRNFLVRQAKGKYVILMGDDDKLMPFTLKRVQYHIDKNPGRHIYAFGFTVIDENDKYVYTRRSPVEFEISIENPNLTQLLLFADIIPFWVFHPFTMCYERSIFQEVAYVKEAHIGGDLLFLMDCVRLGKRIFVISEPLFLWRKSQGLQSDYRNLSIVGMNNVIARRNILSILRKTCNSTDPIFNMISTFQFRRRFLYDQIVRDKSIGKADINNLNLKKEDLEELMELYSSGSYLYHHLRIKLYQMLDYIKLFGLKGILQLMLYGYYKLRFKIRIMIEKW